jgi:Domain of unknown function (DUF5666)
MKVVRGIITAVLAAGFLVPLSVLAAGPKTLTGTVIGFNGNQVLFSTTSAAKYSADSGYAQLSRKNGAVMQFSEILAGDKIEVKGRLWDDNSISADSIRDLSLYAHTGTYSGKISTINITDSSFMMVSKTFGSQTIHTNNFTSYTKNNSAATFKDLSLGMTASVKGVWDRTKADIIAAAVNGVFRLIDIYFTGTLSMTGSSSLTVIGNGNVIYGVELSGAVLQSKNGKPMKIGEFNAGDNLRVWGKHLSGSVAIVGTRIIDSSSTK